MSFLNKLKSQASAVQTQQAQALENLQKNTLHVEKACQTVSHYFRDLGKHLNVLQPAAPAFTLDGKTPWPAMKLVQFHADARKKMLRSQEVFDFVAIGWNIVPQTGAPVQGRVSANFPPELERVQQRLQFGHVEHARKDQRHPEKL